MRGFWSGAASLAAEFAAVRRSWSRAVGAHAHGGVKLEQDECVLQLGPSTMHFIGYQRTGEEEEFCQDIAKTGPTVIALTAVSPDLRDMAIGVAHRQGCRRRQKDKANLDALTVAFHEPKVYRNGIMTFEHDFKDAGRYIAIVTVRDDLGNEWVSRFPFGVGLYTFWGMIEYILYGVAFLALVGVMTLALRAKAHKAAETANAPA